MESDSGFSFVTPSDDLWEGPTPDPKADAEKMLQETKPVNVDVNDGDNDNDDDDDDVSVDSAFAMEGGGWVNVDMALLKIVLLFYPLPPRSDQYINSPYNFNTMSSRQVMRIKKIIN